jgi:hypothetical protein
LVGGGPAPKKGRQGARPSISSSRRVGDDPLGAEAGEGEVQDRRAHLGADALTL